MFSIIVPVHNVEKYLEECIESILKQSFADFELILVENASTDKSLEICKQFLERDKRIKLYVLEEGNVSKARNLGIEKALKPWTLFVDADDFLLPNVLEVFKNCITAENFFDWYVFNYTQKKNLKFVNPPMHAKQVPPII